MMTSRLERLEVFTIEDNIHCSPKELLERAENIAASLSQENGWQGIQVHCITNKPHQKDGYLKYDFEILGIPNKGIEKTETKRTDKSEDFRKTAASPDAEI